MMPFAWLRGYRTEWLPRDLVAGLTVWAVLVPESLAYATIAGVSPVVGLYAAPAALVLYAAFGSSRQLIVGPMSATAALSAAIVADLAVPGSDPFVTTTVALALVTGIVALVAGLLRLGFVANFISEPVLKGFIVGLALTIIAGQLPKLFGVEGTSGDFFERIGGLIRELGSTDPTTLALGLVCLAVIVLMKELVPVVPGALVAVVIGIGAVNLLGLDERGVAIVGEIPSGLPAIAVPSLDVNDYLALVAPALGVVVIGFAEGLGAAKAYARRNHEEIDANRELFALGASNVGAGLVNGMIVNGSLSKTAVNGGAGARSQLSSITVAALVVVTLLFLTFLFETLPEATLAAIVIAAVVELVDVRALARLFRMTSDRLGGIYGVAARADFIAATAALVGVLVFDTLPGLVIGVFASIVLVIYRASRPNVAILGRLPGAGPTFVDVARHPDAERDTAVVVLRPEAALFFANAEHVRAELRRHGLAPGVRAVVLDFETVPELDVTAAQMLGDFLEEARAQGVVVALARNIGQVRDLLQAAEAEEGLPRIYPTVADAVSALRQDADR